MLLTVERRRTLALAAWRATILLLIALGGAGLAVAADRAQNSLQRPELTWRADRAASPSIEALYAELVPLEPDVAALSHGAQEILGSIIALELEEVEAALATGDEAALRLEAAVAQVAAARNQALDEVDEWRLGATTRDVLDQLIAATVAAEQAPGYWRSLASQSRLVVDLVRALRQHENLVSQATAAGRDSRWREALSFLDQADERLAGVRADREALAAQTDVTSLDDLIARYAEYDAALRELYEYVRETGNLQGPEFQALQDRVDAAQRALPGDSALTVVVSEVAGRPVTDALISIEEVRGAIVGALEAVVGSPEPTEPGELPEPPTDPSATQSPDFSEVTLPP